MDIKQWLEGADMPVKQDGQWIDLETGIPFSAHRSQPATRRSVSAKAQDARAIAKAFGGKALTGTTKQKEWAEKIRAEKLKEMTAEQAELVVDPTNILQSAKFWIEHRNTAAKAIAVFEISRRELLKQARALKAANDAAGYAAKAAEYNTLTAQWGWV